MPSVRHNYQSVGKPWPANYLSQVAPQKIAQNQDDCEVRGLSKGVVQAMPLIVQIGLGMILADSTLP
jgi:hypothetical protein